MCCKKEQILRTAELLGEDHAVCLCAAEYRKDKKTGRWQKTKVGAEDYHGA